MTQKPRRRSVRHAIWLCVLLLVAGNYEAGAQQARAEAPLWTGIVDTTTLLARVHQELDLADSVLASILSVRSPRTVTNTMVPLHRVRGHMSVAAARCRIAFDLHPDAVFRSVGRTCADSVAARIAALDLRTDVYRAVLAVRVADADSVGRYVRERWLASYRRNGATRDAATRARLQGLRKTLARLETKYTRATDEPTPELRFAASALAGLPEDWLRARTDSRGMVTLRIRSGDPDVRAVQQNADSDSVRKLVSQAWYTLGYPQNVATLDSLRRLRHELATLLGYRSWAAYLSAPNMLDSPKRIRAFFASVDSVSARAARREYELLVQTKAAERPGATSVELWEAPYWRDRAKRKHYDFDEDALRPYMSYGTVRRAVFETASRMYDVEIRPATQVAVWHPSVQAYELWENGELRGRFYLDMIPRAGKRGGAAAWLLRGHGAAIPEVTLVTGLATALGDTALLTTDNARTFFHEFGHLMHRLFSERRPLSASAEFDFGEAPSQIMEQWLDDPATLVRWARHFRTGEPLPMEIAQAFARASQSGRALGMRGQIAQSQLFLDLFDGPPRAGDLQEIELRSWPIRVYPPLDWYHAWAGMRHIASYSSNLYTYAWSQALLRDLLAGFDQGDLLSPERGRRYRKLVLEATGTMPASTAVERFLGRPTGMRAFRDWLGEEPEPGK